MGQTGAGGSTTIYYKALKQIFTYCFFHGTQWESLSLISTLQGI